MKSIDKAMLWCYVSWAMIIGQLLSIPSGSQGLYNGFRIGWALCMVIALVYIIKAIIRR